MRFLCWYDIGCFSTIDLPREVALDLVVGSINSWLFALLLSHGGEQPEAKVVSPHTRAEIVQNDSIPAAGSVTLRLEEVWRLGEDDPDGQLFGAIHEVLEDAHGRLYLLDVQLPDVKVFSPEGDFIRSLGREGEGPGEYQRPRSMFLHSDGRIGVLDTRITYLDPDGRPAGTLLMPERTLIRARANQRGLVVCITEEIRREDGYDATTYLARADEQGNEIVRLLEQQVSRSYAKFHIDEETGWGFRYHWTVGPKGRIYAAPEFGAYRIHVWSPDGALQRVIERDYTHRQRTDVDMKLTQDVYDRYKQFRPNATFQISPVDRDIFAFYVRADGSLWVLPSHGVRGLNPGTLGVFDVFDANGQFHSQVTLLGSGDPLEDTYYFLGERLYVVSEAGRGRATNLGFSKPKPDTEDEVMRLPTITCYRMPSNDRRP